MYPKTEINCIQVISYKSIPSSKSSKYKNLEVETIFDLKPKYADQSPSSLSLRASHYLPKLVNFPTRAVQLFGFLPYKLDQNSGLHFSPKHAPFSLLLAFLIFTVAWKILYYTVNIEEILYPVKNMTSNGPLRRSSTTEKLSEHLVTSVILFSTTGIRILALIEGNKVTKFYSKLTHALENIRVVEGGHENIEEFVRSSGTWITRGIMASASMLFAPNLYFTILQYISICQEQDDTSTMKRILVGVGVTVKNVIGISESFYIFWMAALIQGIQLGFVVLEQNFKGNSSKHEIKSEPEFEEHVENINNLKSVVENFGMVFSLQIILMMLSYSVIWAIDIFLVINKAVTAFGVGDLVLDGIVVAMALFMCNNSVILVLLAIVSQNLGEQAGRTIDLFGQYGFDKYSEELRGKVFITLMNFVINNMRLKLR